MAGEFHGHSEFSQYVLVEHWSCHGKQLLQVVAGLYCSALVAGLVVVEVVDMAPVCCRTHLWCQALVVGTVVVEVVEIVGVALG